MMYYYAACPAKRDVDSILYGMWKLYKLLLRNLWYYYVKLFSNDKNKTFWVIVLIIVHAKINHEIMEYMHGVH